ncbi:hypothetical protein DOTSEDRAFT_24551 [Dothistroma septosporum NZE10]|uniref:Uncharacterized protein n=1 Tax=Dothistroma septosporum (strain NZE10 / CBS 128990) TaxID=675120 RepID=N1PM09_DOTSN|nr:hypothetical protein DOTSEDRAFT_24551 [Dothistroma septosporum NZE10]
MLKSPVLPNAHSRSKGVALKPSVHRPEDQDHSPAEFNPSSRRHSTGDYADKMVERHQDTSNPIGEEAKSRAVAAKNQRKELEEMTEDETDGFTDEGLEECEREAEEELQRESVLQLCLG